ncbi:hypothetical protein C3L33_19019, partial [Rhododendron williamsianum]
MKHREEEEEEEEEEEDRLVQILDDHSDRNEQSKKTKHRICCSLEQSTLSHSRSRFLLRFLVLHFASFLKRNFPFATRLIMGNSRTEIHLQRLSSRHCALCLLLPQLIPTSPKSPTGFRCWGRFQPPDRTVPASTRPRHHRLYWCKIQWPSPPIGPTYHWDSLAYEALIDHDNTTIVFVKGLNVSQKRAMDPSQFECVYGSDFTTSKLLLLVEVLSIGQEIVRCITPLSILSGSRNVNSSVKVSVRGVGKPIMCSVARPDRRLDPDLPSQKKHQMCVCTMLLNQAQFLREWVVYHARIGVQRWFIYDNNSDDDISSLIKSLDDENFNITRHVWPWIKTQEAGFVHCALRAKDSCEWVGFIDVDEFLHFPSGLSIHEVIGNFTSNVAELRINCHSFGPSGLKRVPTKGVTQGYTCRMAAAKRHKSIVRPEALNSTLINSVHHFLLTSGFEFVTVKENVLVINHYKYQVWEVFKEKFYRRVATYVADWQVDQNEGSRDRTPGLGTRPLQPPDWSTRFCEVVDTGLRDRVAEMFTDPKTR